MKRLITATLIVLAGAGCAGRDSQRATGTDAQSTRVGAGDDLGWQLHAADRAVMSASVQERTLDQ